MPVNSNIQEIERQILEQSGYLEKGLNERLGALVGEIQQRLIAVSYTHLTLPTKRIV